MNYFRKVDKTCNLFYINGPYIFNSWYITVDETRDFQFFRLIYKSKNFEKNKMKIYHFLHIYLISEKYMSVFKKCWIQFFYFRIKNQKYFKLIWIIVTVESFNSMGANFWGGGCAFFAYFTDASIFSFSRKTESIIII